MNNKLALIITGIIMMSFFLAGLLDMMYSLGILENLVSKIILIVGFLVFMFYLFKINIDKHKKNLP